MTISTQLENTLFKTKEYKTISAKDVILCFSLILLFQFLSATNYSAEQKEVAKKMEQQRYEADTLVRAGNLELAIEILESAFIEAKTNELDSLSAAILTDLAEPLVKSGDYQKATENCLKAADIFDSLQVRKGVIEVYYLLGNIFNYTSDYNRAKEYFKKAIDELEEIGDKKGLASALNNYALILNNLEDYIGAEPIIRQAIQIKLETGDTIEVVRPYFNLVQNLEKQKKYREAIVYLEKTWPIIQNHNLSHEKTHFFNTRAIIEKNMGNHKKAENDYLQALIYAKEYQIPAYLILIQNNLAQFYQDNNQFENALNYYLNAQQVSDSLNNIEKQKELEALRESFAASEREKEIELLKKEESISSLKIRLLVVSIILIILTLGGGIYYQRTIHERKRQLAKIEAAKLQQELDLKNQQLTSKTLEMIRKNDFLESLSTQLSQVKEDESITSATFTKITREIGFHQSMETDWEQFQISFNDVHKGFTDLLKDTFPKLSATELRHSSLLKLGLSIKETASLLGITPASVKVSRNRMKKKMELSGEQSLQDFLISLK